MNVIGHAGELHASAFNNSIAGAPRQPSQLAAVKPSVAAALPAMADSSFTRQPRHAGPAPLLVYPRPGLTPVMLPVESTSPLHMLSALRMQVRNLVATDFPDIRALARKTVEARMQRDLGLTLDADRTYFNLFDGLARQPGKDGVEHRGHPLLARTLTEVQMYGFDDLGRLGALSDRVSRNQLDRRTGIYRDGEWGTRFGSHNKVTGLTPVLLQKMVKGNALITEYAPKLADFWNRSLATLQIMTEADILHFAMTHRRADDRAGAIGLEPEAVARLGLSETALDMLAEAIGHRNPDASIRDTRVHALDINGYASEDIAWMQAGGTDKVVMIMPGNKRHIREYDSLAAMRGDIRRMTLTEGGRDEFGSHFSRYNRVDGNLHQGVDKWLLDIAGGHYNNNISLQTQPFKGDIQRHLGPIQHHARSLLSNKALGMLSEAAGYSEHAYGAHGTKAFVFDINTYPSSDMSWLLANDGHVVLIMPGAELPVQEFESVGAMRGAIRDMALTTAGIDELVRHFSIYNRRDGPTYQGVDQWLIDIRGGQYDSRVAYAPQSINGSVFRNQIKRMREADLEQMRYLSQGKADSAAQRREWVMSYGRDNRLLAVPPLSKQEQDEISGGSDSNALVRLPRSPGSNLTDACARAWAGVQLWADSISQRMQVAAERLRPIPGAAAHQAPAPPSMPMPVPPSPSPSLSPPGGSDNAIPGIQRRNFQANDFGFIERSDFDFLYRYEFIPARRYPIGFPDNRNIPEEHGFVPQDTFAAGRRMLPGDVVDFYLTPEAARRAAGLNRREGGHYWLYGVDAQGLVGVSVGDNRANNPDMETLMQNRGGSTQVRVGGFLLAYTSSDFREIEGDMVQLRMDDDMARRVIRQASNQLDEP